MVESQKYALENAAINNLSNYNLIEGVSENNLNFLTSSEVLIVDPPSSGLHEKLINSILKDKPEYIFYLSCNPQT